MLTVVLLNGTSNSYLLLLSRHLLDLHHFVVDPDSVLLASTLLELSDKA